MSVSPRPNAPSVSVVIPAYNYGRFVGAAIDSVLAQRYPRARVEVIVVDDGSTDDTSDVLARYGGRIRAVHQANGGVARATEHGLRLATGELWTILGADDYWPRDRLDVLVRAMARYPHAGLVYGDMSIVKDGGQVLARSFRAAAGIRARSGHVFGDLLVSNFISGGALMMRAEHRDSVLPFPATVGQEDWWLACGVARVAPVQAIDRVVSFYRLHGANTNLGSQGPRRIKLYRRELPFRRWLLLENALSGDVAVAHLRAGLRTFDEMVGIVATADGADRADLVACDRDGAVAELHLASAALDEPDVELARRHLIRAAALDPELSDPRELLGHLDAAVGTATLVSAGA